MLYLVARVVDGKPTAPQIHNTVSHKRAAQMYEGLPPGARLAVWRLGEYPASFFVGEDGTTIHDSNTRGFQ